ncbi:DHA2 family efflux MFS transporter permease subunit [Streptomyces sp. NPDC101166]|uniref:DHA2 family efflux MFS transporter permease subunit n=1 Tax=Streptomyces sp. NPDC101166 TaxID=3366120 RepID=UPI0037F1B2FF
MTSVQQKAESRRGWRTNPWTSLIVLALGFFLTMLDVSIVNIAIPDIREDLSASLPDVLWAVNAYVLVVAVLLITAGRLGDLYGPRRLFLLGIVVFTVFSLVCGLADSIGVLIAARALQGLGAALLLPQTMAMIVSLFPAERRGLALGVWGAVGGVAAVVGPSLGGVLVTSLGWQWIFYVNVPVGAAAVVLTLLAVPDLRFDRRHRLDLGGISLASAGLFCLTFPLMEGERFDWAPWVLVMLAASVVLGAAFLLHERRRQNAEPLVPFPLFRDRNFSAMLVVAASVAFGIIALMLLLTLFFQSVLDFSALRAGLALAPPALISTALAPFAGRFTDRFDARTILLAGLVLTAVGMIWTTAVMDPAASWSTFLAPMVVIGLGNGLLIAPMAAVAMREMPPQLAGAASGVLGTMRQLGPVLAVTLVGLLIEQRVPDGEATTSGEYADVLRLGMALPISAIVIGALVCGPGALRAARRPPTDSGAR